MNYDKMLDYHKEKGADVTIAVREVPWKEAPRFGIMNTDADLNIIEFQEKPKEPKSNLASMGIYIFTWKKLRAILVADMVNPDSSHDFGNDVIPTYLNAGDKLVAWKFKGYWKDVGTIDSLWEANMDLLVKKNELDLGDSSWKIYTDDAPALPQYIGPDASVENSYITQGVVVDGEVKNSVLFTNAAVAAGAKVIDSVLMPGAVVKEGACVVRALVADGIEIGAGAVVGNADSEEITLVAQNV
jgi:glucose-1-phosphate adenylyltransferase